MEGRREEDAFEAERLTSCIVETSLYNVFVGDVSVAGVGAGLMAIARQRVAKVCAGALAALTAIAAFGQPVPAAPRTNLFGDPFVQATSALAGCPEAEGPLITAEEARAQSHMRAEKGTTCHYVGRCRLPNAYLYDKEIVPRVVRFINMDARFNHSTIWVLGQRRWVYLKGCVASIDQARQLEAEVRLIDDVETVVNELMVGAAAKPPYAVAR